MKKTILLWFLAVSLLGCGGGGDGNAPVNGTPPVVTLLAPTSITVNSAMLYGSVIPNGLPTECWFEYGTDPSLTSHDNSARRAMGAGIASQLASYEANGLNAGTTYYYRFCASNSLETVRSSIASFTTSSPGSPPAVSTLAATAISATEATLNGNVTPNGLATNAWFEWGTDPTLVSHNTTATQSVGAGTTSQSVSVMLSGLSTGVTYYFRVHASNSSGTSWGTIASVKPGSAPSVTTLASTLLTATGATLNGNVTPNGLASTGWFEWSTDPSLRSFSTTAPQSAGSGTASRLISAALTGLATGTTYYYRVAASNNLGTSRGTIVSFSLGAPAVTTLVATSVTATGSTLCGYVTPNGLATTSWFEWGTDPAFVTSNMTVQQLAGSGTISQFATAALEGLSTGATYYFRVCAANTAGTSRGAINSFTPGSGSPGPVYPPPAGLWQPSVGATPSVGNFIYLKSDPGDYIGAGQTYTYTMADAQISLSATGGHFATRVDGNQGWWGDFQAMNSLSLLQPGFYDNLQRWPFHNPVRGGLSWSGEGLGCNTLSGWFAIDNFAYDSGVVAAIDLRFEQHCEGGIPALRGQIHWTPNDNTVPPGPVYPVPEGLWQPPPGSTPSSGNYVYLQSDTGDYIGAGQTYAYTPASAQISVGATGGHLSARVAGNEDWWGDFQTMNTLAQLQPGYYGDLQRYPFHNPVRGGLSWSGEGRGCNTLTGWFAVDNITYNAGALTAIDLRFEQHCEGGAPALHGQLHWVQ